MNYKIRKNTIERIFDHAVSKKVIIENAYDDYHVQHVHLVLQNQRKEFMSMEM